MKITGFQKTSLIDYPGHIVTIVFTQGCNFRCPYCHNSSLIRAKKNDGSYLPLNYLFDFLHKRRNLIDGVSITGGEPTLQPDLFDFISDIKSIDLKVKLDTNGTNPEQIKKLIRAEVLDYIAMDVKGPIEKYKNITGRPDFDEKINAKIIESIKLIKESDIDNEFRTTIVPGLLEADDMKAVGNLIRGAELFYIQNFRPNNTFNPEFMKLNRFPVHVLKQFKDIISPYVKKVEIRD